MALTVAEAAEQWLRAKPIAKAAAAEADEAAAVLKEYFRRTGKGAYRQLVGFASTPTVILDSKAVRADYGDTYDIPGVRETLIDLRPADAKTG